MRLAMRDSAIDENLLPELLKVDGKDFEVVGYILKGSER